MIAKGFAQESRREKKGWLTQLVSEAAERSTHRALRAQAMLLSHCDDEQRPVRLKERARAALARKWPRLVCRFDHAADVLAVTMK